ncbi:MAG: hypothetical protein KDE59_05725, partial [Anaerolineales bacterium]|nr:hypothetical protein [Anaerolineales bacterium]
ILYLFTPLLKGRGLLSKAVDNLFSSSCRHGLLLSNLTKETDTDGSLHSAQVGTDLTAFSFHY